MINLAMLPIATLIIDDEYRPRRFGRESGDWRAKRGDNGSRQRFLRLPRHRWWQRDAELRPSADWWFKEISPPAS